MREAAAYRHAMCQAPAAATTPAGAVTTPRVPENPQSSDTAPSGLVGGARAAGRHVDGAAPAPARPAAAAAAIAAVRAAAAAAAAGARPGAPAGELAAAAVQPAREDRVAGARETREVLKRGAGLHDARLARAGGVVAEVQAQQDVAGDLGGVLGAGLQPGAVGCMWRGRRGRRGFWGGLGSRATRGAAELLTSAGCAALRCIHLGARPQHVSCKRAQEQGPRPRARSHPEAELDGAVALERVEVDLVVPVGEKGH